MPKTVKRRKNKLAGRYRNRWPDEAEISGRMIPKWGADSCRNRWPDHPEIRTPANLSRSAVACGYRGASYNSALHDLGFVEGTNLVLVTRAGDCVTMVQLGRADITPLNEYRYGRLFQLNAMRLMPLQPLREVELYLALSLDFSAEEVALWQHTLEQIYRDGTLRTLYQNVFPEQIIVKLEQLAAKSD